MSALSVGATLAPKAWGESDPVVFCDQKGSGQLDCLGIEVFVLPGGAREIPGMYQRVGARHPPDELLEGQVAELGTQYLLGGRLRLKGSLYPGCRIQPGGHHVLPSGWHPVVISPEPCAGPSVVTHHMGGDVPGGPAWAGGGRVPAVLRAAQETIGEVLRHPRVQTGDGRSHRHTVRQPHLTESVLVEGIIAHTATRTGRRCA